MWNIAMGYYINIIIWLWWWLLGAIIWPIITHFFNTKLEKEKIKLSIQKDEIKEVKQHILSLMATIYSDDREIKDYVYFINQNDSKKHNETSRRKIKLSSINPVEFWIISIYLRELKDIYFDYYNLISKIKKIIQKHINLQLNIYKIYKDKLFCDDETCKDHIKYKKELDKMRIESIDFAKETMKFEEFEKVRQGMIKLLEQYLDNENLIK